jgi:hypothetical protein
MFFNFKAIEWLYRLQEMSTYLLHPIYLTMASRMIVEAAEGLFLFGRQEVVPRQIPSKNMRI